MKWVQKVVLFSSGMWCNRSDRVWYEEFRGKLNYIMSRIRSCSRTYWKDLVFKWITLCFLLTGKRKVIVILLLRDHMAWLYQLDIQLIIIIEACERLTLNFKATFWVWLTSDGHITGISNIMKISLLRIKSKLMITIQNITSFDSEWSILVFSLNIWLKKVPTFNHFFPHLYYLTSSCEGTNNMSDDILVLVFI